MDFFAHFSQETVKAEALFIAQRILIKDIPNISSTGSSSYRLETDNGGIIYIFRYGVVVFFNVEQSEINTIIDEKLSPYLQGTVDRKTIENETITITIHPDRADKVFFDHIEIKKATPERFEVISDILAKSTIMAHYECDISKTFDIIDPISRNLQTGKLVKSKLLKTYLKNIGLVLNVQRNMAGRVEVREKPEVLWEQPTELNHFYARLEDEYEIIERHSALKEKLEVIHQTAETMVDLLHSRQSLRVEWYIVILIVFDIVLSLAEKFLGF